MCWGRGGGVRNLSVVFIQDIPICSFSMMLLFYQIILYSACLSWATYCMKLDNSRNLVSYVLKKKHDGEPLLMKASAGIDGFALQ